MWTGVVRYTSIRYTDSFKITFPFLLDDLPLITCDRRPDPILAKTTPPSPPPPPPPLPKKCRAEQSLDFLLAFQDKLNESESEMLKYINEMERETLILPNNGLKIKYCF